MDNRKKYSIITWFILGFVEPPLMWLFLMWYTSLYSFKQVLNIALNPMLWIYVGSFLVGLFFIVKATLNKVQKGVESGATDKDLQHQNLINRLPWLFIISEIIYCLIGPNTGLGFKVPLGLDYFLAWSIGIPIILVYSMPFFVIMLNNLENWSQNIPLYRNKMIMTLKQKLYICITSATIGTMLMITICVYIILNKTVGADQSIIVNIIFQKLIFIFIISAAGILIPFIILIQKIAKQIKKTLDFAKEIAAGNLSSRIKIEERDEIGSLLCELNAMTDNIELIVKESNIIAANIVDGELDARGDSEKFNGAFKDVVDGLNTALNSLSIVKTIMKVLHDASEGDLSVLVEGDYKGDFEEMKNSVNRMVEAVALKEIMEVLKILGEGNISRKVEGEYKGHFEDMKQIVNNMIENIASIIRQANAIAQGDFASEIVPKSDQDILGKSLLDMTEKLRDMTKKNDDQMANLQNLSENNNEQIWIKNGQTGLTQKMRGEQNIAELAKNAISYLAKYVDSPLALVYLLDDEKTFKLVGSYAYKSRKSLSNEFKIGEGLVGQVGVEKEEITITDVPDDYIRVQSGLGESVPKYIVALPLILNNEIKGVIEIASLEPFSDNQKEFLRQVTESMAIAFHSAQAREKMSELLNKTQKQSEELQAQQEELKSANEELTSQTNALKSSEENLKAQQEELQAANEELEEKSTILEKQKDEIGEKNVDLQKASLHLEEKAKELELTSKYKSEFLANMSHELRTPLNSVIILSKLLSENKKRNFDTKQVEAISTIYQSSNDLLSLINEILDLSKVEAGRLDIFIEDFQLQDLSEKLIRNFKPVAENKNIKFIVSTDSSLPKNMVSDEKRIHQILKNLISNAIKFTSEGSVTVAISKPKKDADLYRSKLNKTDTICFNVIDNGIGIPEEKQKVIFEAFQQVDGSTSRKFGGTGLGLSISRELAKILGGEIQLESVEGKGSTFSLYLPIKAPIPETNQNKSPSESKQNADTKPINESESKTKTPKKILENTDSTSEQETIIVEDDRNQITGTDKTLLIVEDDLKFAKILQELAQEKGFKVLIAPDGETSLKLIDKYLPCAIVLDICLPGISGWIVMDHIQENPKTRHIPVHFISGTDYRLDALKKGAIGFLQKPVEPEQVNQAFDKIQSVISKHIKDLLIVEDDPSLQKSIKGLLDSKDIKITSVGTGKETLELLEKKEFDCMVLDLGLPDISGFDVLKKVHTFEKNKFLPVLIFTGRDLTPEELKKLQPYSSSIIVKGVHSLDRLLDETSLFLHRLERNLPEKMQKKCKLFIIKN